MINIKNKAEWNTVLNSHQDTLLVVDFWASWCGPCRSYAPTLNTLDASLGQEAKVVKVQLDLEDTLKEVASSYSIMSIPTTLFILNSEVKHSQKGAIPLPRLKQLVSLHRVK